MNRRLRLWVTLVGGLGTALLLVAAVRELPAFGGGSHPYGARAVGAALGRRTANAIASVNFDQRAFDTLGEQAILFGAVLGTVVVLRQTRDERRVEPEPARVAPLVRNYALFALPVTLLVGLYIVAHGQLSPGGGFQGGIVAATALHLLYVAVDYRALKKVRSLPLFILADASGEAAYLLVGAGGLLFGTVFLANVVPYGTFGTLASGGIVPVLNAAIGVEVAAAVVVLLAQFLDQAIDIETPTEGDPPVGTSGDEAGGVEEGEKPGEPRGAGGGATAQPGARAGEETT